MVTRVSSRLPACLEPDRPMNLRRMLGAMGLGPQEQEWKLDVRPALLAEDADRSLWCEDKQEAVQRILAHPGTPAMLWFVPDGPGVMPPAGTKPGDQAELMVGAAAGSHDVQVTQFAVAWSVDTQRGRQRVTLPWRSIGAIRDPRTGEGWWWPRDLPAGPRADFQTDAVLWTVLQRLGGIPLAAPSPGPVRKLQVVILQRPLSDDKPTALRQLLSQGTTIVLADPAVAGVRVPPSLPGRARVLMVPLLLPGLDPKLRWDDEGFGSQSPDYDGVVHDIWLPWRAVFLLSGGNGSAQHAWPADFPDFLVAAQHALRAVQHSDGGVLPPELDAFDYKPTGDGLGLGLTVGPDGRHVLVVGRPLGVVPPPQGAPPGQIYRSTMELSFRLPRQRGRGDGPRRGEPGRCGRRVQAGRRSGGGVWRRREGIQHETHPGGLSPAGIFSGCNGRSVRRASSGYCCHSASIRGREDPAAPRCWREGGDKDDSDITEIRGPPGDLRPAEDQPDDDWDGWDEPPPLDWAA